MCKNYLGVILANILAISGLQAETASECPSTITMAQLKEINKTGSLVVGNVHLEAHDRNEIHNVTPAMYQPSSLTALAHLRDSQKSPNGDEQCHYGYKSTLGNVASKFSENVMGTDKNELNDKHDYKFTLVIKASTSGEVPSHTMPAPAAPIETTTTPQHDTITHAPEALNHNAVSEHHQPELATHSETPEALVAESPALTQHDQENIAPTHENVHPEPQVSASKSATIVITREDIAADQHLESCLKDLGLLESPKISEFVVDRRYDFIEDDAKRKETTNDKVDMVKMNRAYACVKSEFIKKRQH